MTAISYILFKNSVLFFQSVLSKIKVLINCNLLVSFKASQILVTSASRLASLWILAFLIVDKSIGAYIYELSILIESLIL